MRATQVWYKKYMPAKIVVTGADAASKPEIEEAVRQDIEEFNVYFQRDLKNSPLIASEVAILKTYLYYKIVGSNALATDVSGSDD